MNTAEQTFRAQGGAPTQTSKFIDALMEADGQWVSLISLVAAGCGYACHSRAADARRLGYNVENRVVYHKPTRTRESFYRVIP